MLKHIDIDKGIFENLPRSQKYHISDIYTKLAAQYYQKLYSSELFEGTLTSGVYTYLSMSIIYRLDNKKYYLFEYCVDSMEGQYPEDEEKAFDVVQCIIDRRAEFTAEDMFEYIRNKIGDVYTFGIGTWINPSFHSEIKKEEIEQFNRFKNGC